MSYHTINIHSNQSTSLNSVRSKEFILKYGPYAGRSAHWIILKDPAYVDCYCKDGNKSSILYIEFCRLKNIMDNKSFCRECRCGSQATRFSFHSSHSIPQLWCNSCNPARSGIAVGSLSIGSTYNDLCNSFKGKPSMIRRLLKKAIKEIRESKGYQGNLTMKKTYEFFEGTSAQTN